MLQNEIKGLGCCINCCSGVVGCAAQGHVKSRGSVSVKNDGGSGNLRDPFTSISYPGASDVSSGAASCE